jgi:hypothetical protein
MVRAAREGEAATRGFKEPMQRGRTWTIRVQMISGRAFVTKHTPGPWTVEDVMGDGPIDICGPDEPGQGSPNLIATAFADLGAGGFVSQRTAEANARLIAAAPDLLEACLGATVLYEAFLGAFAAKGYPPIKGASDIVAILRAAIIKAEVVS